MNNGKIVNDHPVTKDAREPMSSFVKEDGDRLSLDDISYNHQFIPNNFLRRQHELLSANPPFYERSVLDQIENQPFHVRKLILKHRFDRVLFYHRLGVQRDVVSGNIAQYNSEQPFHNKFGDGYIDDNRVLSGFHLGNLWTSCSESHRCTWICAIKGLTMSFLTKNILCQPQLLKVTSKEIYHFSPLAKMLGVFQELDSTQKFFISTIETAMTTIYSLLNASNLQAAISIIIVAFKAMAHEVKDNLTHILEYILPLVRSLFLAKASVLDEISQDLNKFLSGPIDKSKTQTRDTIYSILFSLVLIPVVFSTYKGGDLDISSSISNAVNEVRFWAWNVAENTSSLMTGFTYILKYGYILFTKGPKSVLFTSSEAAEWFTMSHELSSYRDHMAEINCGLLSNKGIRDVADYLYRIETLRSQGLNLHAKAVAQNNLLAKSNIEKANTILMEAYSAANRLIISSGYRKAPCPVLIASGTGDAKSTIAMAVKNIYGVINQLPLGEEFTHKFMNSEFMDGYNSSKWCGIVDDPGAIKVSIEPDPIIKDLINILNNCPYITNQAAIESKGTIPLLIRLLIATTNDMTLQNNLYFHYPAAAARRFPFIIVPCAKPEKRNSIGIIDGEKIDISTMDAWTFDVVVPGVTGREAVYTPTHTGLEWNQVVPLLVGYFRKHGSMQDKMINDVMAMHKWEICRHDTTAHTCEICAHSFDLEPVNLCVCSQSEVEEDSNSEAEHLDFERHLRENYNCVCNKMQLERHLEDCYATTLQGAHTCLCSDERFSGYMADNCSETMSSFTYYANQQHTFLSYVRKKMALDLSTPLGGLKDRLVQCSNSIKDAINPSYSPYLLTSAGVLALAYAITKIWPSSEELGSPDNLQPAATGYNFAPTWINSGYQPNFKQEQISTSKNHLQLFKNRMVGVKTKVLATQETETVYALQISGNLFITVKHIFEPNAPKVVPDVVYTWTDSLPDSWVNQAKPVTDMYAAHNSYDVAIYAWYGLKPGKNLTKYVYSEILPLRATATGRVILYTTQGVTEKVADIHVVPGEHSGVMYYCDDIPAVQGSCGSLLFIEGRQGLALCGILFAYDKKFENRSYFTPITLSMVESLKQDLSQRHSLVQASVTEVEDENNVFMSCDPYIMNNKGPERPLHPKSDWNWIKGHSYPLYGYEGYRPKLQTAYFKTPLNPLVSSIVPDISKMGLPTFKAPRTPEGVKDWTRDPFSVNAQLLAMDKCNIPFHQLELAYQSYVDRFTQGFYDRAKELKPLSETEILHGTPSEKRLDFSTSMGFPENKTKSEAMELLDPSDNTYTLTGEQREHMDRLDANLRAGLYTGSVFTGSLKDEPAKLEKISKGLTRMFCGAPGSLTFLMRKYCLPVLSLMKEFPFECEILIGVRSDSPMWTEVANYLSELNAGQVMCGDQGKYDKRLEALVILFCMRVVSFVASHSKHYSEEDIRAIDTLGYEIAYPKISINSDIALLVGNNPSGHTLTTLFNSLAGSLTSRVMWIRTGHDISEYNDKVRCFTFGDDSIMSTSEPTFNQNSLSEAYARIGMEYTDFKKSDVFPDYYHITEAEFLKRGFIPMEREGEIVYVDVLSLKSIAMMFAYGHKSVLLETDRLKHAMTSARSELMRYYISNTQTPAVDQLYSLSEKVLEYVKDYPDSWFSHVSRDDRLLVPTPGLIEDARRAFAVPYEQDEFFVPDLQLASTGAKSDSIMLPRADNDETLLTDVQSGTVTFAEEESAKLAVKPAPLRQPSLVGAEAATLANALARPVAVASNPITIGTALTVGHNLVDLYFNNTLVSSLVQHFGRIRWGAFNVRIMFQGNPAVAGIVYTGVIPNHATAYGKVCSDSRDIYTNNSTRAGVVLSQYGPKTPIYLNKNSTTELAIPWLSPANYADVDDVLGSQTNYSSPTNQLYLQSPAAITSANGSTIPIRYTIYCWLTDVELLAPVQASAKQDETNEAEPKFQLSKVASRIASMAGEMTHVPVVGTYAATAQSIATGVGTIAAALGFSKPSEPYRAQTMRLQNGTQFANADGVDNSARLGWDSQVQVSTDRSVAGLEDTDEMSYNFIGSIPSYLGVATLSTSDLVGAIHFIWRVSPRSMRSNGAISTGEPRWLTPMGFLSMPHTHAGGTMGLIIHVGASSWQMARLLITWTIDATTTQSDTERVLSYVLDISGPTTVHLTIPWLQDTPVRRIDPTVDQAGVSNNYNTGFNGVLPTSTFNYNGTVVVSTLNPLTGPGPASTCSIAFCATLGSDFVFQGSSNIVPNLQLCSNGDIDVSGQVGKVINLGPPEQIEYMDNSPMYTFGERVTSMRTIAKRTTHWLTWRYAGTQATGPYRETFYDQSWPVTRWEGTGPDRNPNNANTRPTTITNANQTTYGTYVKSAYQGFRGAKRSKYILNLSGTWRPNCFYIVQRAMQSGTVETNVSMNDYTPPEYGTTFSATDNVVDMLPWIHGGTGMHLQSYLANSEVEVEVPYYSQFRYLPGSAWYTVPDSAAETDPALRALAQYTTQITIWGQGIATTSTNDTLSIFSSVGDDFDCICWIGSPSFYSV